MVGGQLLSLLPPFTPALATKIPGSGPGAWGGPGCLCWKTQLPCPLLSVHQVVSKKPAFPSCAG